MLDYRVKESLSDIQKQQQDAHAQRQQDALPLPPKPSPDPSHRRKRKRSFLQWFYDLPISRKQLIALFTSEIFSLVLVGVGARWIIDTGLRAQLFNQATSEVAVTELNYNIKVNQMGFGFRGQADNAAIIAAAKAQTLTPDLQNQVKQILKNEIQARNIEYATLVGRDSRIIVNANTNRQGEIFNPNNLVQKVFDTPEQIKVSSVVSWSELTKESPPLPPGFAKQDALIRYTVTPVKDPATKMVIGALVSGDIVNNKNLIVKETLKAFGGGYSAVYFRKPTGEFALATALDQRTTNLDAAQPNVALPKSSLLDAAVTSQGKAVTERLQIGKQTYTVAAKALPNFFGEAAKNDESIAILVRGTPETALNQLLHQSLLQQLIVFLLALLVISLWALILKRAILKPIEQLRRTTQEFSKGNPEVRAEVFAHDEIGNLAITFNEMADNIEANLEARRQEARRAQLLNDIILRIGESLKLEDILNTAVKEIRFVLKTDRVVVYTFNEKWQGTVTAESVAEGWPRALGAEIDDPCFADKYVERYRKGRVQPTTNIYEAGLNECHIRQLAQFAVKANLVAPILQNNQLLGLLIAHQCSGPRAWQQSEIDLFAQLATQVGLALDRANILEQQKIIKEKLQQRALELLMEVDPISKGDLTIRASVTEDEIGTIADSYNLTVSSLRKIVTQVQGAAQLVATTANSNEASILGLSQEAVRQVEEVVTALDRIHEMSFSIRSVAANAQQAEAAVKQATETVEAGDAAMNRTVNGIVAIQETVAETSKKVKQLGESSQKISKVVNLIGTFAAQTNLLALKASIEAARAGEEGRGFAVLADEVRMLARQSAAATAEIGSLVSAIQTETNEVVAAMEAGTQQVVTGSQLVDETRHSLNKITAASAQISALVEAIASDALTQSQFAEEVTQMMSNVAAIANQTSSETTLVSASFKELLAVATELQASAAKFKVS